MSEETSTSVSRAIFERMLGRLPANIRDDLTPQQLAALRVALQQPEARHLVDNRVSVRWLRRHYYVRLLIGHERRSLSRVMRERQIKLGPTAALFALFIWLAVSVALMALIVVLYVVKSAYGFDILDGHSFLHGCFFN